MKKLIAALAFALAVAAPSGASAQTPFLGFRIGFGLPAGDAARGTSQSDVIKSVVPIQADLGWSLGPIDVGGYLAYGFGSAPSSCEGSCTASDFRVGAQGMLRSPLGGGRDVWAGILAGWQRTKLSASGGSLTASGWEGGLQGGYDFSAPAFGMGPFLMLTVGQYDSIEVGGVSSSSFDKKYHETVQFGVRGYFKL